HNTCHLTVQHAQIPAAIQASLRRQVFIDYWLDGRFNFIRESTVNKCNNRHRTPGKQWTLDKSMLNGPYACCVLKSTDDVLTKHGEFTCSSTTLQHSNRVGWLYSSVRESSTSYRGILFRRSERKLPPSSWGILRWPGRDRAPHLTEMVST